MTPAAVGVGGLALWPSHPVRAQVSTVERCACIGPPPLHPPECIFHRHYVCPSVPTQNERDRQAGWVGGAEPTLSRLAVPIKTSVNDARPWKLYTPPGMCAVCAVRWCMYVIRYVVHAITITRNVRPLTLKPTFHIYDLLLVLCTWPSFCTKWRALTIWVTRCLPVVQCTSRLQQ